MFFKRLTHFVMGLAWTSALFGCGLKVGEKPPSPPAIAYSGKGYSCVGQIPQHLQKYMNDELSDDEISEFMRCLQNAFSSFAQYTRGRDQSTYAADEIRNFLERSFVRDRSISDGLLHEFMVIKQAIVGGDSVRIARSELFDAVALLEDLRVEAIRLRPHIKYLNPKTVLSQDPQDLGQKLGEANDALKLSIDAIAGRLQKSKKVYPLANLESFVTEFRAFVHWEDHFLNSRPVPMWISLLRSFKEITVSSLEPDVIHEDDWVPLLQAMSGWYISYLQYEVGIKGQTVIQGVGLQNTIFLADELLQLTRASIQRHKDEDQGEVITFEQIHNLNAAMHDLGWIPDRIRVTSLDQAIRAMVTRMAGDALTKPGARTAVGLDSKALKTLEREFKRWAHVQTALDGRYHGDSIDAIPLTGKAPNLQTLFGLSPDVRAKIEATQGNLDWTEFAKVEKLIRPLFVDGSSRVELVPDSQLGRFGARHGFYNLSLMNILRSSAALVFRGYAEEDGASGSWMSGITGSEMQKFYVDFRDLGIDLAFVDKRNTNSGSRAFIEGKLFTSSSTGFQYDPLNPDSGKLSFVEAMEYFAFLYSGGEAAKDIFNQLSLDCPQGPLDINGTPKVGRACAINEMPALLDRYMGNMPYLQEYLRAVFRDQRAAYSQVVVNTAFSRASSDPQWLEKNEVSTLTVVGHYAESVMVRFDVDQDGRLTNRELEKAIPLFSGFIKKIGKDKMNQNLTDVEARAAFFYILTYKSIPTTRLDSLYIVKNQWLEPTLSLDRLQLAEVFNAIIGRLMEVGARSQAVVQMTTH